MAEAIQIDRPEIGLWALRLVGSAPEVAARIYWAQTAVEPGNPLNCMDRSPHLAAEINGNSVAVEEVWHRKRRPINRREYDFLLADRRWASEFAPRDPMARPDRPVTVKVLRSIPAIGPQR